MAKRALVLAAETYDDSRFAALPGAAYDAERLREVLGDPAIGDFEVSVLSGASTLEWKIAIEQFFSSATSDDTLLLHLSCHGRKNRRNQLHFITKDSNLDALAATSVEADFIAARMEESRSRRIILLLDCCYSGAFNRGMRPRGEQEEVELTGTFEGSGRIVITSSTALQYSYESALEDDLASREEGKASVFTSAVVRGLQTGEADLNGDGFISADELYQFISHWVPKQMPDQTPTLSVTSAEGGSLVLARNPHAVALAHQALRGPLGGGTEPFPMQALALSEAGLLVQQAEGKAAELSEQLQTATIQAARNAGPRARTARALVRMLSLLFGLLGGAIGIWVASFWVAGFTLPNDGRKFPALAICVAVLNMSFLVVAAATAKVIVLGERAVRGLIMEELSGEERTKRKVLWSLLFACALALPFFAIAAELIWLAPATLRLGGWISHLAGFPVGIPSGWGSTLIVLFETVGGSVAMAVVRERMPDEEVIEERGPGYVRRVRYKKFGPFRWKEEYRQDGGFDLW
ncbi:caspase domain-containing protein [Streptomyces sp. NPDC127190]|uniref:caspase family protein n=1 Tax=unclassified Streptomyces TaxID=2593676 RepID=UPI0036382835